MTLGPEVCDMSVAALLDDVREYNLMLAGRPERAAGALSRAPPRTETPIYKYPFFVTRLARVASMASLARPHAAQARRR